MVLTVYEGSDILRNIRCFCFVLFCFLRIWECTVPNSVSRKHVNRRAVKCCWMARHRFSSALHFQYWAVRFNKRAMTAVALISLCGQVVSQACVRLSHADQTCMYSTMWYFKTYTRSKNIWIPANTIWYLLIPDLVKGTLCKNGPSVRFKLKTNRG